MAVGVIREVVAISIGKLPFFDFAEGSDMEACVEARESSSKASGQAKRGKRCKLCGGGQNDGEKLVQELLVVGAAECGRSMFRRVTVAISTVKVGGSSSLYAEKQICFR